MAGTVRTKADALHPLGYAQVTDVTVAIGLAVPANAVSVIVIPTADVMWRDDGTAPTSAEGMPLVGGQTMQYDGNLAGLKFIQASGSAALNVSFYR